MGPGTSEQSHFKLQNKFRKIPLLAIYYLTKFDKAIFELFQKLNLLIYASEFTASQIIPLPFVLLNLESLERKRKNYKKSNILKTKEVLR